MRLAKRLLQSLLLLKISHRLFCILKLKWKIIFWKQRSLPSSWELLLILHRWSHIIQSIILLTVFSGKVRGDFTPCTSRWVSRLCHFLTFGRQFNNLIKLFKLLSNTAQIYYRFLWRGRSFRSFLRSTRLSRRIRKSNFLRLLNKYWFSKVREENWNMKLINFELLWITFGYYFWSFLNMWNRQRGWIKYHISGFHHNIQVFICGVSTCWRNL